MQFSHKIKIFVSNTRKLMNYKYIKQIKTAMIFLYKFFSLHTILANYFTVNKEYLITFYVTVEHKFKI